MKTNVPMQVMAQQSAELRQQVNSQPFKPAQVVGKIELKPRVEVKIPPKLGRQKPQPPKPAPGAQVKQKRLKRADDNREKVASNQQMLAELQYVKKQLREAQEKVNALVTAASFVHIEVRDLLALIETVAGVTVEQIKSDPAYQSLRARVIAGRPMGAEAAATLKVVMAQTDLGPPKPMVPVLVPLATIEKLAVQDDLVGKAVELAVTAKAVE